MQIIVMYILYIMLPSNITHPPKVFFFLCLYQGTSLCCTYCGYPMFDSFLFLPFKITQLLYHKELLLYANPVALFLSNGE